MIIEALVSPRQIIALLHELELRGLPVPARALHGRDLLDALDPPTIVEVVDAADLLSLSAGELADHVRHRTLLEALTDPIKNTAVFYADRVVREIQQVMRAGTDAILDVLRPSFDTAAAKVHGAVKAGITPGMRADEAILVSDKAVAAWRGLPEHLNALQDTAQLRIQMVDVFSVTRGHYGLCFTAGQPWDGPSHETEWDRWLRLSVAEPVRLLPASETENNAKQAQAFELQSSIR